MASLDLKIRGRTFDLYKVGVCPACVSKTCAVRPAFAGVIGELGAADPSICSKGP